MRSKLICKVRSKDSLKQNDSLLAGIKEWSRKRFISLWFPNCKSYPIVGFEIDVLIKDDYVSWIQLLRIQHFPQRILKKRINMVLVGGANDFGSCRIRIERGEDDPRISFTQNLFEKVSLTCYER